MAQTFIELQKQISALQAKAAAARTVEIREVIRKIRAAIDVYGLTASDLFGSAPSASGAGKLKRAAAAKYADNQGNTWAGRGKRPAWLRAALASGASLDQFRTGSTSTSTPPSRRQGKRKIASSRKVAVKYRDAAGNTWTGRGLQPRWLRSAIAEGRNLQDFAV